MGVLGIPGLTLGALIADLRGNDETRPWTRKAYVLSVLAETGLLVAGASTLANFADSSTRIVGGLL